jgi:hypothetical protein
MRRHDRQKTIWLIGAILVAVLAMYLLSKGRIYYSN